jgi:hypothetical protein
VQTGYQRAAEQYLINFFKPIWNSEIQICFGVGKRGDDPETRANGRPPWDTLHPAQPWADRLTEDQKPASQIRREIAEHLRAMSLHATLEEIMADFLGDLGQIAPAGFRAATDDEASVDDSGGGRGRCDG